MTDDGFGSGGGLRLVLAGDVDATDRRLLHALVDRVRGATRVRVDLSRVGHAGGVFLGWLARLCARVEEVGASLVLEGIPDRVARLIALVGMEAWFDVVDAADEPALALSDDGLAAPPPRP
jgi:anti-anti-sigma factor